MHAAASDSSKHFRNERANPLPSTRVSRSQKGGAAVGPTRRELRADLHNVDDSGSGVPLDIGVSRRMLSTPPDWSVRFASRMSKKNHEFVAVESAGVVLVRCGDNPGDSLVRPEVLKNRNAETPRYVGSLGTERPRRPMT